MPPAPESPPILRRLLEAAGYRLEDRAVGLLALRSSDARAVLLVDGRRSPTEVMDEIPSGVIHRSLVYAEDPGSVARELASNHGVEILDASSIGPALGELLLPGPSAGGEPPPTSPSDPLDAPARVFPDGDQTVRARLDRRDAEAIAGVEGPRTTLRLIPFFVAPYRVRVATAQGTPGGVTDHLVAVQGLSGRVETWEAGERELSGVPPPSNALPPVLTEEAARSAAELTLRKRHTVSVDHTEQHGGAIVIERRRVAPGPNDLRIGGMVLVHVPFWYIEGLEGRVIIDAVSGARAGPADPETSGD